MNGIRVAKCQTPYHYKEDYILVDEVPIIQYLDQWIKEGKCSELKEYNSLNGLYPAWGEEMMWEGERKLIKDLVYSEESLNVPILVCEDDLDLSCIVIIAHIRKAKDFIYWDRIGLIDHRNHDFIMEKKSGIMCLEAYTEEDWEKYGDNIATETVDSYEWSQWIAGHWTEELYRRGHNYLKPYMQKEENVIWIEDVFWCFEREEYKKVKDWYYLSYGKEDL